jgi:hypothetical protein
MADRRESLQRTVSEAQMWADFAQTDVWKTLKSRIENEIVIPAKEAFHSVSIDGKSNDELVRNMVSMRTTVKVGTQIINLVESQNMRLKEAHRELEKIAQVEKQKEN